MTTTPKIPKVFPIVDQAYDNGYYLRTPRLAEMLVKRYREAGAFGPDWSWYGAHLTIVSANEVHVDIFNIACSFEGGIGKHQQTLTVKTLSAAERKLVKEYISRRQLEIATEVYEKQLEDAKRQEILKIQARLFSPETDRDTFR